MHSGVEPGVIRPSPGRGGCCPGLTCHICRRRPGEVRVAFVILVSDNSMKGSVEPELLHHMLQVLEDPAFQVPAPFLVCAVSGSGQ